MSTKKYSYYLGVKGIKMNPTKKHRPAVWEMMLGTVNAMNDNGEVKYFDYDYESAIQFANVNAKNDVRIGKRVEGYRVGDYYENITKHVRRKQIALWVEK